MQEITVGVDGMMCGMCESHVNDAVRTAFPVKKVSSSHKAGKTEILADYLLDEEKLKADIRETGYEVLSVKTEPFVKKGFWIRLNSARKR